MSDALNRILVEATAKTLILSTEHVTAETMEAARADHIAWAATHQTTYGFLAYVHEERHDETHDDLWAVIRFARLYGFQYVLFDSDASVLSEAETGLAHYPAEDEQ